MNSEIFLPPLPKCWDSRHAPCVANNYFSNRYFPPVFLFSFKQLIGSYCFPIKDFCLSFSWTEVKKGGGPAGFCWLSDNTPGVGNGQTSCSSLGGLCFRSTSFLSQGGPTSVQMCMETWCHLSIKHTGNLWLKCSRAPPHG